MRVCSGAVVAKINRDRCDRHGCSDVFTVLLRFANGHSGYPTEGLGAPTKDKNNQSRTGHLQRRQLLRQDALLTLLRLYLGINVTAAVPGRNGVDSDVVPAGEVGEDSTELETSGGSTDATADVAAVNLGATPPPAASASDSKEASTGGSGDSDLELALRLSAQDAAAANSSTKVAPAPKPAAPAAVAAPLELDESVFSYITDPVERAKTIKEQRALLAQYAAKQSLSSTAAAVSKPSPPSASPAASASVVSQSTNGAASANGSGTVASASSDATAKPSSTAPPVASSNKLSAAAIGAVASTFDISRPLQLLSLLVRETNASLEPNRFSVLAPTTWKGIVHQAGTVDTDSFPAVLPSPAELELLHSESFLAALAMQRSATPDSAPAIAVHVCWETARSSDMLLNLCLQRISDVDYIDFWPALRIIQGLLCAEDSLAQRRADSTLPRLLEIMEKNQNYWRATELCINTLLNIGHLSPRVKAWLIDRRKSWEWVEKWLERNGTKPPPKNSSVGRLKSLSVLWFSFWLMQITTLQECCCTRSQDATQALSIQRKTIW